jgi:DNA-directed RNA polymerase specialized sigma24 family protein
MLTGPEREQFLEKNRNKLVVALKREFPRLGDELDDIVHGAIYAASFQTFDTEAGMWTYLKEKATFIAIDTLQLQVDRRNALKGLPRRATKRDPMRKIDWKIDLESAIREATWDQRLQSALWHHLYEGYTQADVSEMLGKDQSTISRAAEAVSKIMRRGGYRD